MKSEHRHELETNSLYAWMVNFPEKLKQHSSRIMTVIALVLLGFAVWNYRHNQYLAKEQMVSIALGNAWNTFDHLQRMNVTMDPATRIKTMNELESEINTALQAVIDEADPKADRAKLASAFQLKGDLYWALASDIGSPMPSTQPSTTQPATRPVADYLSKAEAAYNKVVSDYSDMKQQLTVARFGLAAIAENRQDWTNARKIYSQIMDMHADKTLDGNERYEYQLAKLRNDKVEDLQKPIIRLDPAIVVTKKTEIGTNMITPEEKPVDSTLPGNIPSIINPTNP